MSSLSEHIKDTAHLFKGKYPPFIPPDGIEGMTSEEIEAHAEASWCAYINELAAKPFKRVCESRWAIQWRKDHNIDSLDSPITESTQS